VYKTWSSLAITAILTLSGLATTPGWANEVEDEERAVERQQESDGQATAGDGNTDTDKADSAAVDDLAQPAADPAPLPLSLLGRQVETGSFATLHWTPD